MGYREHAHCVTPPDDTIVWRYMSFAQFVYLVVEKHLWFSRADLLDDPREGLLTDAELKELQLTDPEIAEHNRKALESGRRGTFLNCWTRAAESIAMWNLYANTPGSVAIKSTVGRLKRAIKSAEQNIHITEINYLDWGTAPWPNNLIGMCARKVYGFLHEREVRMIYWIPDLNQPTGSEVENLLQIANVTRESIRQCEASVQEVWKRIINSDFERICLVQAPRHFLIAADISELIEEVIVAPKNPDWTKLVSRIYEDYGASRIPIYRSELAYSKN